MNNYYFELIEAHFDNHSNPETTEKIIGRYRDFEPAREKGLELAKIREESERFKDWSFLHKKIPESSILFLAEKYNENTDNLEQHAITVEKKYFKN